MTDWLRIRRAAAVTALGAGFLALAPQGRAIIPVGDPMVDSSENILANGNFEMQGADPVNPRPLRWWVDSSGLQTLQIVNQRDRDGNSYPEHTQIPGVNCSSLQITDKSAANAVRVRSEKQIAVPGMAYTLTGWVYNAGSGAIPSVLLEFWDQKNARVDSTTINPAGGAAWTRFTTTYTCSTSAGITHLNVCLASTQGATNVLVYFDDITLRPVAPYATALHPGARELFIDNYRLESFSNVQRTVVPPTKSGPLLGRTPGNAWESDTFLLFGTVLHDQPAGSDRYRMWYRTNNRMCYATSTDGITWTKPDLGGYEYPLGSGNKHNNIAFPPEYPVGREEPGQMTVVYDTADHTYKALAARLNEGGPGGYGYFVYTSPTGTGDWKVGNSGDEVLDYNDTSNLAIIAAAPPGPSLFIATTKQSLYQAHTSVVTQNDRAAFVSISTNFTTWTAPGTTAAKSWTLAVEGDFADDRNVRAKGGFEAQIYGMPVQLYQTVLVGIPWMFEVMNYTNGPSGKAGDGPVYPQIAASRDLRLWSRPCREPLIPLGFAGAWDDGSIYTASNFIVTPTEIWLYYGGLNATHGGKIGQVAKIGRATWRLDGFVALRNGGDDTGNAVTKAFTVTGATTLHVNARLNAGGNLKVEILDAAGNPLPGYGLADAIALTGDQLDATVAWNGGSGIGGLAGAGIKLKFHLTGGDLYSYWFQ